MKTVLVSRPGGIDALEVVDRPEPLPGPGEVQIRAAAFGVSTPDVLIRKGVYKWMPPLPANPGNDLAGFVSALGAGVSGVGVGARVLLSARDLPQRGGCYAEVVVAPADAVHVLEPHVDLESAVCLPNYQVAQALLQECRHPRALPSILVVGAAGGVGTALTQLARRMNLRVIGTVSTREKADFARANGVDDVIFYRDEPVVDRVLQLTGGQGVGAIFDHAGGPDFVGFLGALGKWGTLVTYNAFAPLPEQNVVAALREHMAMCPMVRTFSFHIYDHDRDGRRALMREVIGALARGEIRPPVATRIPITEVRRAHALLESGTALGKILMVPGGA